MDNHTCALCHSNPAEVYCYCLSRPLCLCASDFPLHSAKPGVHQPIPIWTFALLPEYMPRLQQRNEAVRRGTAELTENLRTLERCRGEVEAWTTVLVDKIQLLKQNTLTRVEALTHTLEAQIHEALREEADTHYEDCPLLRTAIAARLRSYSSGSLTLFRYSLASLDTISAHISAGLVLELDSVEDEVAIGVPKSAVPSEAVLQAPVVVMPTKLLAFDLASRQWRGSSLSERLEVDNFSAVSWVSSSSVFVCGGGPDSRYQGRQAYLIVDSAVLRLADMDVARSGPGVLCEEGVVYVFGGTCKGQRLAGALGFALQTSEWRSLGAMKEPRALFNPCVLRARMYLCGGYSRTVECFDPSSLLFLVLKAFALPGDFAVQGCCAVADPGSDCIVCISKHIVTRWRPDMRTAPHSAEHRDFEPWSRATPVVYRSQVLLVDMWSRVVRGVDLSSGAVAWQVALPQA